MELDFTAIFTALLVLVTAALWWATRQLVKGTEEASRRQLRAYVTVTEAHYSNDSEAELKITVTIQNNGNTPAKKCRGYLTGIVAAHTSQQEMLPEPIYEGQGYGPLGAGAHTFLYTRVALAPSEYAQIAQGLKMIYLVGKVEYTDIFDAPQTLKFVLVNDQLARPMFRPWGDFSEMT
jgi:hypothetical protein